MNVAYDPLTECHAELDGELLVLENACLRREYVWNQGHLVGRRIVDKTSGHSWDLTGSVPAVAFPGFDAPPEDGELIVTSRPATAIWPAYLQVDVTTCLAWLRVRRRFRIYPGCPAMACDLYLRGQPPEVTPACPWLEGTDRAVVIERLAISQPHLQLDSVQFIDRTDWHNTLVTRRSVIPYRRESQLAANLILIRDVLAGRGLFLLKEAPCSDQQLAWPGFDVVCRTGEVSLVGMGVGPHDLEPDHWIRGYGFVLGVATGDEHALLSALRSYQEKVRTYKSERDDMIVLNTWGDRGQDTRICESFALAELEEAAHLGITHFQLDDGWQTGRSSNSAFDGGSLDRIWDRSDYWIPHPARFPDGLSPIVERSNELGIELCLWFNPSKDDSYAHWRDDADILISLYREYGIHTFKIDGVVVSDKKADLNLRAMFERVIEATHGEAVFSRDVTAGRRWGYHYGNEYGNIFLENRYTDWGNYYPHWTLRNLWMLSRYIPPQNLQVEFLNKWRNAHNYPLDDPLAPRRVPFDYCFAIAMMAQPLAWFEATGLRREAFEIAPTVRAYRAHQERIHAGQVFPIGEEPSGTSWTGFQSIREGEGYVIVYRERNDRECAVLKVLGLSGKTLECTLIAGHGADFTATVDIGGGVEFCLPRPFTFALYAYGELDVQPGQPA